MHMCTIVWVSVVKLMRDCEQIVAQMCATINSTVTLKCMIVKERIMLKCMMLREQSHGEKCLFWVVLWSFSR
jgi:hypothetical protein